MFITYILKNNNKYNLRFIINYFKYFTLFIVNFFIFLCFKLYLSGINLIYILINLVYI